MKKVSSEWMKEKNCEIIDPDGWDRKNYDYSFNQEKITREEFYRRLALSTIGCFGEICPIEKKFPLRGKHNENI